MSTAARVAESASTVYTGIQPYQALKNMVREGEIRTTHELFPDQLQPASLDVRLGPVAYRVPASFLPGAGSTVWDKIRQLESRYEINLQQGAVLEKDHVYLIPLLESLDLKRDLLGFANPKSSTGRLDILTRLITDHSTAFDRIEKNYRGPLYLEVAPRSFNVCVHMGTRLSQLRFRSGSGHLAASELQRLHD